VVRIIDLSVPTEGSSSEATPVEVVTLEHGDAPAALGLRAEDFPEELAISNETVTLTSHTGTHMDAPLHYGPWSGERPARPIGEVPLEWCYGNGVRIDVRHLGAGEEVTAADVAKALRKIDHKVNPGDIVLVWTGRDRLWGTPEYLTDFPGLKRDAVAYLVGHGVRVIGTDAWGLDRPVGAMIADYRRTGDRCVLWPAHLYGREREYCQLEKLANLDRLPDDSGFTVCCFPTHLAGAGAAWTRVVALVDES
jgi:kynurenine formamidase